LNPSSGPPGTVVQVTGWSFGAAEKVVLYFVDSITGKTKLKSVKQTGETGAFTIQVTIPVTATHGKQKVTAKGSGSGQIAKRTFTVT
jgi:hypothetical protein